MKTDANQLISDKLSFVGSRLVTPMSIEHLHRPTCFGQNISTPLLSANKCSSAEVLKLEVTDNFGLIRPPDLGGLERSKC